MTLRVYNVQGYDFRGLFINLQDDLVQQPPFDVGEWQSIHKPMLMRELRNVSFSMKLPSNEQGLAKITGAHLPWAEDHFLERISGSPLNPSPSEAWWPFAQKKNDSSNGEHKSEGKAFSHTYPERMWPKFANEGETRPNGRQVYTPHQGLRFELGDLDDVIRQLAASPKTRQAFLPIWFPEDTGAVHGKRVPCTLGYHFAIRDGKLDITYYMRSTDLLRHFQDDIYLAGRLAQHFVQQINELERGNRVTSLNWDENPALAEVRPEEQLQVGELIFHTANLHIFDGDLPMIKYRQSMGQAWSE